MPRGYRGIGFAAALASLLIVFGIGLFIGTLNYPDEQRHQEYRYTDKDITDTKIAARPDLPKPKEYKSPCDKPYGKDESDLCAQWRAAKAAENSAFWAKWGVWIAVIGSSLLMWQIMLTREAVKDTGDATKAMREANEIARDGHRAWVKIEIHGPRTMVIGHPKSTLYIGVELVNFGQSPATNIMCSGEIYFEIIPRENIFHDVRSKYSKDIPSDYSNIIFTNDRMKQEIAIDCMNIAAGEYNIIAVISCCYRVIGSDESHFTARVFDVHSAEENAPQHGNRGQFKFTGIRSQSAMIQVVPHERKDIPAIAT